MRVLYVAPRYHTNQTAVMKGWLSQGDEVCFLAQYAGRVEDYSVIRPEVIGYSRLFEWIDHLYVHVFNRKKEYAVNMRLKCGVPPVTRLIHAMRTFRPDVVIARERSVYTMLVTLICRCFGWPVILYNQSPALEEEKHDLAHRIMRRFTPKYRITPVYSSGRFKLADKVPDHTFFLPFLMEPSIAPDRKKYFCNGGIQIFCIGKYQRRKNHKLMIQAVERLMNKYPIHLVIAGEVSDTFQEAYYEEMKGYVSEHGLEQTVELHKNLDRKQVFDIYQTSDLFVLPSTDEPAAVSHLEAMSFSLPVISGDDNGTASYIENGRNGYIFKDGDLDDLCRKMEQILSDRDGLLRMGAESYRMVLQNHQFSKYYSTIRKIMEKIAKERKSERE